jgi:hypothetical protein
MAPTLMRAGFFHGRKPKQSIGPEGPHQGHGQPEGSAKRGSGVKHMPFELMKTEDGHVKLSDDGHPVYRDTESGAETPINGPQALEKITSLNSENKKWREQYEGASEKAKRFEAIGDPEVALKALETVKALDDGQLVKVEKLEAAKKEAISGLQAELEQARQTLQREQAAFESAAKLRLFGGDTFKGTRFEGVEEAAYSLLANSLEVVRNRETGAVAYGADGQPVIIAKHNGEPIISQTQHGETATGQEALQLLLAKSGLRDRIQMTAGGSGASGGLGGGKGPLTPEAVKGLSMGEYAKARADGRIK